MVCGDVVAHVCMGVAELAARRERDLQLARDRLERTNKHTRVTDGSIRREEQYKEWRERQQEVYAALEERGVDTLLAPTAAHERGKITPQQLYCQQEQRSKAGAHAQRVGFGGYDLSRGASGLSRAVPQWAQGVRHVL